MKRTILIAFLCVAGCATPGLDAPVTATGVKVPGAEIASPAAIGPAEVGPMIVAEAPIDVLTANGYTASEELVRALQMMRVPESGRFALTLVSFDPRTGERRGLRFDPRLPDGQRWSVSEAPDRANVERVSRRLHRLMEPMRNPDLAYLAATPSPQAMRFTGLASENETSAIYRFSMEPRTDEATRFADRVVGDLVISRPSGAPVQVRIRSTEAIRSGLARVDSFDMTFDLVEVRGCCMLVTQHSQGARGSALFMPSSTFEVSTYADIEFFPNLARDADVAVGTNGATTR
jgi:hypothetical protein